MRLRTLQGRHDAADEAVQHAAICHERATAGVSAYDPTTAWRGLLAVGEELTRLWRQYERGAGDEWKRWCDGTYPTTMTDRLRQALRPAQGQLPALHLYRIDYPWKVAHAGQPVALLIGTAPDPGEDIFITIVLEGVETLVKGQ